MISETDKQELVKLVREMVAIPSVNVPADEGVIAEAQMADYVQGYLSDIDMRVERIVTPNRRPHLYSHRGQTDKPQLMLSVHMDTVGVEEMTIEPFDPVVKDGKIFGRGSCDTKGSMAVYLWAMRKVWRDGIDLPCRLEFLAMCDEESGCTGSYQLARQGFSAERVIIGEPTLCEIASSHCGKIKFRVTTHGKASHSSVPDRGRNAIYDLVDIINVVREHWLGGLEQEKHPVLGPATTAVTLIDGGLRDNTIPDKCSMVVDARPLPSQDADAFAEKFRQLIETEADKAGIKVSCECISSRPSLDTPQDDPLVKGMVRSKQQVCTDSKASAAALHFLTDAGNLAANGSKCVVFGPGNIENAHSAVEFLSLDQLYQAAEILWDYLTNLSEDEFRV